MSAPTPAQTPAPTPAPTPTPTLAPKSSDEGEQHDDGIDHAKAEIQDKVPDTIDNVKADIQDKVSATIDNVKAKIQVNPFGGRPMVFCEPFLSAKAFKPIQALDRSIPNRGPELV